MTQQEKLQLLTDANVLQTGHFRLTSGRHSDRYMQCARVFEQAKYSETVCAECEKFFCVIKGFDSTRSLYFKR